jgi:ornithine cyclodeaminase
VEDGCHVTAVGADGAGKQELDPELLARAELVTTDSLMQAVSHGEVGQAVREGLLDAAGVKELGAIAAGQAPGRSSEAAITVCDLTGIGAADTAVATLVAARAAGRVPAAEERAEHFH